MLWSGTDAKEFLKNLMIINIFKRIECALFLIFFLTSLLKVVALVLMNFLCRFMEPAMIVCLGGILPFGSIFIEM